MLEIFSALMGLIQGVLIMLNKKENWIFYMLNIITLMVFSYISKLYGDVLENAVYMLLGLLGTLTWYSSNISEKFLGKSSRIQYCSNKERLYYILGFIGVTILSYLWLLSTDDPQPLLDAVTTGLGLTATVLMALKKVDAWALWFIDDILMAIVYFRLEDRALYLMTLNIVWVFLAIASYYTWDKITKLEKEKEGTTVA